MASNFREVKDSPKRKMLRKKVNSDDVDERIVLEVTLVMARDTLKDHCARNQKGTAHAAAYIGIDGVVKDCMFEAFLSRGN